MTDFVAFHARAQPDKLACRDIAGGESLTYAALDARAWRAAALIETRLARRNIAVRGARIATLARNSCDLVCLYIACGRIGAVLQPMNWRLAPAELAILARDAEPSLLFYEEEFAAGAHAIADACNAEVLGVGPGDGSFAQAIAAAPERPSRSEPAGDDDIVTLLYTSGTTGASKGVMVSAGNARACGVNYSTAAKVTRDCAFLCDMPMFHVVGLFAVVQSTLQVGGSILVSRKFDADETLRLIGDETLAITHYFCVPQMAQTMRLSRLYDPVPLRRLVALQTGGAPHPAAVVRAWLDDGIMLIDGYGMSEAGTVLGMPPGDLDVLREKAGAAGLPAVQTRVRLVTRDGADAAIGEIGEIWISGPSVSRGYWRNEAATRQAFQDGWLKSGDAARVDEDGFYTLVDRWKDMFISGGENVYPAEVEAALSELAGVAESAVFGAPDSRWGEIGVAYVVCAPSADLSAEAVVAHCKRRLAAYKAPKHVRIVASLPRTASGKVQKAELRVAWAKEGVT